MSLVAMVVEGSDALVARSRLDGRGIDERQIYMSWKDVNGDEIGLRDAEMIDGKLCRHDGVSGSRGRTPTVLFSCCAVDDKVFSAGPLHENESPVVY